MAASFVTGLLYFAIVFSFAFVMGTARMLVIAPWLGATAAVLLEVPVIIAASWIVARRLLQGRSLTLAQRAIIGGVAFALTMASEAVLSAVMRAQTVGDWAATLVTPLGLAGLSAQVVFGAMPVLVARQGRPRRG